MKTVMVMTAGVLLVLAGYALGNIDSGTSPLKFCIDGGMNGILRIEPFAASLITRTMDGATQIMPVNPALIKETEEAEGGNLVDCPEQAE